MKETTVLQNNGNCLPSDTVISQKNGYFSHTTADLKTCTVHHLIPPPKKQCFGRRIFLCLQVEWGIEII
jgi:hypothetical protein